MSYAAFSYTTFSQLLARTKIALGIMDGTLEDMQIRMHLIEGAKEIMAANQTIEKTEVLEICDFKAELPCDFIKFDRGNSITFTTNGIADASQWWENNRIYYTGKSFPQNSPYQGVHNPFESITIEVQDGYLEFSNNITAVECAISYKGLLIDDNGEVKIPEINARVIEAYAFWMYGTLTGALPQSAINTYMRIWTDGKKHREAKSKIPDAYQKQAIGRVMNRLLN